MVPGAAYVAILAAVVRHTGCSPRPAPPAWYGGCASCREVASAKLGAYLLAYAIETGQ